MFNRREFVKVLSAVPFMTVPNIAFAAPQLTRREKYMQYLNLYADQSTGIMQQFRDMTDKLSKYGDTIMPFTLALYGDYFRIKGNFWYQYPGFIFAVQNNKGIVTEYQYIMNGYEPRYQSSTLAKSDKIDIGTQFARIRPSDMMHICLRPNYNKELGVFEPYGTSLLEKARIAHANGETGDLTKYVNLEGYVDFAIDEMKAVKDPYFISSIWLG